MNMRKASIITLSVMTVFALFAGSVYAFARQNNEAVDLSRGQVWAASSVLPVIGQVEASPKDETVFANLYADGSVKDINVINAFSRPVGEIVDFGDYASIINLTNEHQPSIEGSRIAFAVDENDRVFHYQGKLEGQALPWIFDIVYKLDGSQIDAQGLSGADGHLQIVLDVRQNLETPEYFRENFMLQIALPFDMNKATSVHAEGASRVVAGNVVNIAFTLLPGESRIFIAEADVEDFEMDGIEITAMKADLSFGELGQDLLSGFDEMAVGMGEMIDGTSKLKDGMADLSYGITRLYDGAARLNRSRPALTTGMEGYAQGLTDFAAGMTELEAGSQRIDVGLSEMAQTTELLLGGYRNIENGLAGMLANKQQIEQLALGLTQSADPQVRVLAEAMLGQLSGLEQVHAGIKQSNAGMSAYSEGLTGLAGQYGEFHEGIKMSADGAGGLEKGFNELLTGTRSIFAGVRGIRDGMGELKNNTVVLPNEVQKLIDGQQEMKEGIEVARDEIGGFEDRVQLAVSFVAPEKARASSVQFVMRTPNIALPETPIVADGHEEPNKDVWQRFLDLFIGIAW